MLKRESVRMECVITLFFFVCSCLVPSALCGSEQDTLAEARRLIQNGAYEEAARILGVYIEQIRNVAKQRRQVAEAHYLLAKMYFEVGDDPKCDDNLRIAFQYAPEFWKDETNMDFRERLEKLRAVVAPQVVEKMKKAEQRRLRPRKKFPWLLVASATVAAVLVVVLLSRKKQYTLSVRVGSGVSGTPAAGSYIYRKGTKVVYKYAAAADYRDPTVMVNGVVSAAEGTLIMNRNFQLEATATPLSQAGTLTVDARNNCLELNGSAAAVRQVPGGSYALQISGNAYYGGTAAFGYVFARYFGADNRFHLAALNIPMTLNLQLGNATPDAPFHAFFLDQMNVMDNYGALTFRIGTTQFEVHGRDNCLLIESVPTAQIAVPAGVYRVRVSGGAFYIGSFPMNEVLVSFSNINGGNVSLALSVGQTVEISTNGSTFHAFFADWSGLNDNSGQLRLEFLN